MDATCYYKGVATISCLSSLVQTAIQTVMAFAGIVFFVMLISGGYMFLFSGGDQKQLEKARGTLTSAIIGLVLLVSGYIILSLIQGLTGVKVTEFNLNIPNP